MKSLFLNASERLIIWGHSLIIGLKVDFLYVCNRVKSRFFICLEQDFKLREVVLLYVLNKVWTVKYSQCMNEGGFSIAVRYPHYMNEAGFL